MWPISELIPQKAPFVFIDRVVDHEEDRITTNYCVKSDNPLVDGKMLEAGLIENMAQSAAALEGCLAKKGNGEIKIGFIGAVKKLEIKKEVFVGDLLETKLVIINNAIGVNIAEGEVYCKDTLVAKCILNIFLNND